MSTIGLQRIQPIASPGDAIRLLAVLGTELLLNGALSPEVKEGLIRLGYSEPCE